MILLGDCLDLLRGMEADSVHAVVVDPPYGLEFMGKEWDKLWTTRDAHKDSSIGRSNDPFIGAQVNAYVGGIQAQQWHTGWLTECFRVMKPGAFLLAFGGSRTFHRLACAIEDAGFELRDTLMWVFGCLSEDTEILTDSGFKPYHKLTKQSIILAYDIEADSYQWEVPSKWYLYEVKRDTAFRIVSDSTDQLVSRGHRCLVERDGKLVFKKAEELASMERVPTLRGRIPSLSPRRKPLLLLSLQRLLSWKGLGEARPQGKGGVDRGQRAVLPREDDRREQSRVEGRSYISQAARFIRQSVNQVCALSSALYEYGAARWLCHASPAGSSGGHGATAGTAGSCASYQPQRRGQPAREPDPLHQQPRPQALRARLRRDTTLARVSRVTYSGYFYCPTVSTGAFVARRNGKVFITGNSGFPKAQSLSMLIDKQACNEQLTAQLGRPPTKDEFKAAWKGFREVVGRIDVNETTSRFSNVYKDDDSTRRHDITAPATELAREWDGWANGGLKPAYEPVLMARKPCEGSTVANIIKHGVGALNIAATRVETGGEWHRNDSGKSPIPPDHEARTCDGGELKRIEESGIGRYPSHLLFDDSAAALLDEMSGETGSYEPVPRRRAPDKPSATYSLGRPETTLEGYADTGGASRFFTRFSYTPKACRWEREAGLTGMPTVKHACYGDNNGTDDPRQTPNIDCVTRNPHPTVKPIRLMRWLIELVTREGDIVLDPLCGSGSTGCAARWVGREFIGCEKEAEYHAIATARVSWWAQQAGRDYDAVQRQWEADSNPRPLFTRQGEGGCEGDE